MEGSGARKAHAEPGMKARGGELSSHRAAHWTGKGMGFPPRMVSAPAPEVQWAMWNWTPPLGPVPAHILILAPFFPQLD